MARLAKDAKVMEDITGLEMQLPSTSGDGAGRAPWVNDAPFRRFLLGAREDYIVDPPAIMDAAAFVGAEWANTTLIDGLGHNIMLGPRWTVGAQAVLDLLTEKQKQQA